jgi:hypothetical protein
MRFAAFLTCFLLVLAAPSQAQTAGTPPRPIPMPSNLRTPLGPALYPALLDRIADT